MSFGQSDNPISENDIEFSVYKEYDKNGNLIRFDSSRVQKGQLSHRSFKFQFQSDSIPLKNIQFDSLLNHSKIFMFKDEYFLDSLISLKRFPKLEILHADSLLKNRFPSKFNFNHSRQNIDSLLNKHFEKMEDLFERYLDQKTSPRQNKYLRAVNELLFWSQKRNFQRTCAIHTLLHLESFLTHPINPLL